jgi:acyl carrier protein
MTPQPATDNRSARINPEDRRQEILRLLGYILGRTLSEQGNPSRASESDWDSLKQIELMFLLEDHFGVRFSVSAMTEMEDVDGILRELNQNLAKTILEPRHAP